MSQQTKVKCRDERGECKQCSGEILLQGVVVVELVLLLFGLFVVPVSPQFQLDAVLSKAEFADHGSGGHTRVARAGQRQPVAPLVGHWCFGIIAQCNRPMDLPTNFLRASRITTVGRNRFAIIASRCSIVA